MFSVEYAHFLFSFFRCSGGKVAKKVANRTHREHGKEKMTSKDKAKIGKREIVTVAEAKKSEKRRSTIAPNIKYDRITQNYIVTLYWGVKDGKTLRTHETFKTLQEAKDKLTEHKENIRKGARLSENPKITMGECINEFISNARIERTTARGYTVVEKRIKTTPLYKKRITNIKKSDIDDYISFVHSRTKLKNCTINKDLDLIHRTLKYAVNREYISSNPADAVEKLKEERFEPQPLTVEEMNLLRQAVEQNEDWRLIIPVYLGAYQGLRRGEIVGLKWKMVSFEDNIIKIRETITQMGGEIIEKPPKTEGSNRDLEMFPTVRDMLLRYRDYQIKNNLYNEYVVVNQNGKRLNPTYLSKKFKEFLVDNGLREIRFHDLRHTFGTRAIGAGVNPLAVSGAMGHSNLSTTLNIYVHSKALDGSREVNNGLRGIFG